MAQSAFFLNLPGLPGTTANRDGAAGMGDLSEAEGGFSYPPHLLATAAAVLRRTPWQVSGLDAVAAGLDVEQTLGRLPKVDLLVLTTSHATLAADRAFLHRLRERKPLLPVLAIGPALSYPQVAHALNDLVDLLLAGEPELALPAAARHLAGDSRGRHLQPTWRPGQVVNPYQLAQPVYHPDGTLADLDLLPMPAWDVFIGREAAYPFLTVLSSRGCPAGCAYCPYVAAQGKEHRAQSPARTVEEFLHVVQNWNPSHIMFRDPVFAHDRNRALAVCAGLRRQQTGVSWECEGRPEHFDSRLLRAMKSGGCVTVKLGLESADPELLVAIGRVPDPPAAEVYLAQAAEVVAECRRLGMLCRVFTMIGLPGQTLASVTKTAQAIEAMRPSRLHIKPYHWYPGISLPQIEAADLADQAAVLRKAMVGPLSRWRRLAGQLRSRLSHGG